VRILFTKSKKIMSVLIRKVTKEPMSHCVIEYGDYIIHSNLFGVHAEPYAKFIKGVDVVAFARLPDNTERLLKLFLKKKGSPYDFGAMFYLGLRVLFPFLPKKNLWQSSGMYLCTEWVTEFVDGKADSMITPFKLFQRIQNNQK
jgi:hypothetical protein